jgi:carbon starvation protein
MVFNDRLDAAVAAFFLVSVIVIVVESVRTWIRVVRGTVPAGSTEVPAQSVTLFAAD